MTDSAVSLLQTLLATGLHLIGSTRAVVAGSSMEPFLKPGDRLLVSRLARCRPFTPERGQIVLLRRVPGERPESVKRVLALPGERVLLSDGGLNIDPGFRREPSGRHGAGSRYPAGETGYAGREWVLGPRDYFVVGDNRDFSTDSRQFGPVRREAVIGVAWYRYAPPQRRGWIGRLPLLPRPRRR